MFWNWRLAVVGVALLAVGCSTLGLRRKPAESVCPAPIVLPQPPPEPPAITRAEKAAIARTIATGEHVGGEIAAKGCQARSAIAEVNVDLWRLLGKWAGPADPAKPQSPGDAEMRILGDALTRAVEERAVLVHQWQQDQAAWHAQLKTVEAKANKELANLADANAGLRQQLDALSAESRVERAAAHRRGLWALLGFGGAFAIAVAFCYLRFGKTLGSLALTLAIFLEGGGLVLYIWTWWKGTILTVLACAAGLAVLCVLLYAFGGTFWKKLFEQLVANVQSARAKLAASDPAALATVDSALKASASTPLAVAVVKAKADMASAQPPPLPAAQAEIVKGGNTNSA